MAVIYLQDANPWGDFGTALGTAAGLWGANRLGEIDATHKAKKTAYNEWGRYVKQAPQSQLAIVDPQGNDNDDYRRKLWQDAQDQNGETAGLWKQSAARDVGAMDSAENRYIRNYMPSVSYQALEPQKEETPDPYAAPKKEDILNNVRQQNGQAYADYYVNAIKGGATPEEAKASTMALMQDDMNNAYTEQQNAYRANVLDPMRDKIIDFALFNTDDKGNKTVKPYDKNTLNAVYPAVVRYNELASAAGQPTIDMNGLNALITQKKDDLQYKTMPNGDYVQTNVDTGEAKTIGNYAAPQDPRKDYINTGNGLYDIKTGQIVEGTQKPVREVSSGGGGGNGGGGGTHYTSAQINAVSRQQANWEKMHPTSNPASSPYYVQLMTMVGGEDNIVKPNRGWLPKDSEKSLRQDIINTWRQYGTDTTVNFLNRNGLQNYVSFVPLHDPQPARKSKKSKR